MPESKEKVMLDKVKDAAESVANKISGKVDVELVESLTSERVGSHSMFMSSGCINFENGKATVLKAVADELMGLGFIKE
ncbi:hypothetical protein [Desulfosporosinus sp. SB140]|uniref:hypothetical protein n=1 Tax=Desulfosporosinus paludis TaxID=3115649 RepID=UPI003890A165